MIINLGHVAVKKWVISKCGVLLDPSASVKEGRHVRIRVLLRSFFFLYKGEGVSNPH